MTRQERALRTDLLRAAWTRPVIGLTIPARIIHEAVTEVRNAFVGAPDKADQAAWCEDVMELLADAITRAWATLPPARGTAGMVLQGRVKSHLLSDCYATKDRPGRPAVVIAGAGWIMLADLVQSGRVTVYEDSPAAIALEMLAESIASHPEWPDMERSATRLAARWIAACEDLGLYDRVQGREAA